MKETAYLKIVPDVPIADHCFSTEAERKDIMYGYFFDLESEDMADFMSTVEESVSGFRYINAVVSFPNGDPEGHLEESEDGIDYQRVEDRSKYPFKIGVKIYDSLFLVEF